MLTRAYWMEIETVMSYIANSINPDGVRAQEIIESLEQDVQEELGHAREFGARIKELYGVVPGSLDFNAEQSYLQPPDEQTDIVHVIKGVIEAESGAIEHYNRIIEFCEGRDPVTQDMVIDDPARRGGPPAPLRGLPARVQGGGAGLAAERSAISTTIPKTPADRGDRADHARRGAAVDARLVHGGVALAALEQPAVHRVGEEAGDGQRDRQRAPEQHVVEARLHRARDRRG